ncbi:MAG: hypothetical protein AAGI51_04820, partial [Pseudomonadota bacterium]
MTVYVTKRPDETQDYALDWTELAPGEALAEDLGWMIVPQEIEPDALTLAGSSLAETRSEARLSGGRAGHLYHVSNRVRTSEGR